MFFKAYFYHLYKNCAITIPLHTSFSLLPKQIFLLQAYVCVLKEKYYAVNSEHY